LKVYGSGVIDQTRPARDRWVTLFVTLLLAAAAAFVIGVAVERDQGHAESAHSQSPVPSAGEAGNHSEAGEGGSHSEAGEHGSEPTENGEAGKTGGTGEHDSDESVLGIDPESNAAVTTAVLISVLLAAVVWRWPVLPTLLAGAVFCLVAAAFDIREVAHQTAEGRTGVAVLAALVAALHVAAAASAAAASAQRSRWTNVAATRRTA
jgi:hypothetical protein